VWVYADIFDYELPWVKPGDRVTMTTQSVPGETFSGELAYIYPYANAKTRTTQVRIVFDNSEGLLRPEALVDVRIASDERRYPAVIPAEAVVRSGSGPQVFVVKAAGKFEPRQIVTGIEADGFVAVVKGLAAEEQVVTSAQFLIDSESKLREAMAKMLSPSKGTTPPAMHEHHHD
ncbi:MAG: efflux RND transporter periplasmic adaptor subunit, partial [Pseudomonadales bacterium]|nr:efflux RND transporter periplasmic adaptor subunit [Pseudomonadales bacterium]